MRKLLFLFAFIYSTSQLTAQQEATFTHYMYNTQAVNPAYVGTKEALSVTALYRKQWVDYAGAPTTQSFTLHTPLKGKNAGVGLSLLNDKIGPTHTQTITADFAYKLRFNDEKYLSIGIKGGVDLRRNTISRLLANDAGDAALFIDPSRKASANIATGLYYRAKKYYVGASVTGLLQNNLGERGTNLSKQVIHGYLIAGTYFNITKNVEFKPTALLRVVANAPAQAEATATLIFSQKISAGAFYRSGDGVGLLAGFYAKSNIYLGYSYDFSLSNTTGTYNSGSHEFILTYDFSYEKDQLSSPRYF